MTISKKIIIAMVCIISFVSLAVGITSLKLAGVVVSGFEEDIVYLNSDNANALLTEKFSNIRSQLVRLINETDLYSVIEQDEVEESMLAHYGVELRWRLRKSIEMISMSSDVDFAFVNVYLKNGVTAISTTENSLPYSDYGELCAYLDESGAVGQNAWKNNIWFDVERVRNWNSVDMSSFMCVRFLYDRVTMEHVGAIVAGINTDDLSSICMNASPEAALISSRGAVISGNSDLAPGGSVSPDMLNSLLSVRMSGKSISYSENGGESSAMCWKTANGCAFLVVPLETDRLAESPVVRNFYVGMGLVTVIAVLIAFVVAVLSTNTITNGLKKLKKVVNKVADGDRNARFCPKKHDEIAYVGLQFNSMLDKLEQSYAEQYRTVAEKNDLELSLLQTKINPHLLYNTLDIAVWSIRNQNPEKAEQLIYALSDFFKCSLAHGQTVLTVADEVEHCRKYTELQCLTGDNKYQLQVDLAPGTEYIEILHLILQPIVENSIIHGFRAFRDDGTIKISTEVKEQDKLLEIHVTDDGMGIPPDAVEKLNRMLNEEVYNDDGGHYGLRNIARRIKFYYGAQYCINVTSEVGEYTDVTVCIPSEEKMGG